ncbi:MAG: glycosyltransferase [Microbacterium sp.]
MSPDPRALVRRVSGAVGTLTRAARSERLAYLRARPLEPDTVLYESFAGNGVLCNPEAIFRALLDDPEFAHLTHVWAISDETAREVFAAEFAGHPRVRAVPRGGDAYWRALSTAGTLINNATFPPQFAPRDGQVYLNTWHGTPLKHMGFDMPNGAVESANTLRNLLMADYLLAANPFMADVMYDDAYRLRNVFGGTIIEEGYPRIDRQIVDEDEAGTVRARLEDAGIPIGDRRIVLFAPTWRGSSFQAPREDLEALAQQVAQVQAAVGPDVVVLLKTHQVVHAAASRVPALSRVLVPNTIPTNVLLGMAAALVTDYSSVFFDFLATGRPIVFLAPDAADYERERGTYFPLSELPGPVTADAATAGAHVARLLASGRAAAGYRAWAKRFVPFDDGGATQRVIDVVFRGITQGRRVRAAASDDRIRVLLYAGGMRSNGITTSLVNLLSAIDPARYDVTVLLAMQRDEAAVTNRERLPAHVRQVFRLGGMNGSKALHALRRLETLRGRPQTDVDGIQDVVWRAEWTRIFGSASFDWVADFSGYSHFWPTLLLRSPDAPRAIWLHNEMAADRDRTVNGKAHMRRAFGVIFRLYAAFDQLVSVSPSLTRVNRAELSGYAPADRFVTVRNVPDVRGVTQRAALPLSSVLEDGEGEPVWLRSLQDADRDECWFVSVGRLSPEKNHARLIRAFAAVRRRDDRARLLIVGGGPLEGELTELIAAEGLAGVAFLAGARSNPFPLLRAADCFVLSSSYEGQPMVLLEAAVCALPIVSTSFASVQDALPAGAIHIVDQDDDALRDGMLAFLEGRVSPAHLDVAGYMAEVIGEFDAVVQGAIRAHATR